MTDFLLQHYSWVKALHLIAVMSWMAGMLYLPRLFVYHVGAKKGSDMSETLKIMEYRLLKFIMGPAMMATWVLGIVMISINPAVFSSGWMHIKFFAVILMTVLHITFGRWRKQFAADKNTHNDKFYRWWNEAPTALMVIIVLLAVAKPF